MKRKPFFALFFAVILLTACGGDKKEVSFSGATTMVAEAPLFEGENTAQSTISLDEKTLENIGVYKAQAIHKAKLTAISLTKADGSDFDNIEQITLQLVSKNVGMQKVAYLSSVPKGAKGVELNIAETQSKIGDMMKDGSFTFVADFELTEDEYEDDIEFTTAFEFSIELK